MARNMNKVILMPSSMHANNLDVNKVPNLSVEIHLTDPNTHARKLLSHLRGRFILEWRIFSPKEQEIEGVND